MKAFKRVMRKLELPGSSAQLELLMEHRKAKPCKLKHGAQQDSWNTNQVVQTMPRGDRCNAARSTGLVQVESNSLISHSRVLLI